MANRSEQWERLQQLYYLAESAPVEDRERVLAEHCSDPALRQEVLAILTASDLEESEPPLLEQPAQSRIGPYTVLRHLGSGGLGSVYLVERTAGGALQRAALKVLAPHAAGPSFVDRFYREEKILGSLDHPNITRMFDAGLTENGQPYLVMEYVDGLHLDVFCGQQKLGISARIELFLQVCDAVAYAHRNLVVHLDLKPSNILVTADGIVKLLDFGTSKMIEPDSLFTATVFATPAYASPEQLRNETVTTACDIYSLGAILFELLAGRRPRTQSSISAMIEYAIKEQEPEPLTQDLSAAAAEQRGMTEPRLRQLLSGDLTTIVAKCLRARPVDRYPSIDPLTDDLRRYLEGRPVLARPQTTWYRVGKFVHRNRKGVAAAVVVAIALVGSLSYGEVRQRQALQEGQRALRMQTFLYKLFRLANSNYTGKSSTTVPEFLQLGVRMLPEYIKDPRDLREAQMSLAESMFQNDDLNDAQRVFMQTIASAKAAGDTAGEAESEAFAGNIAYLLGNAEAGANLTAHALDLSRGPNISPAVRVWAATYYAWNRENSGFRSDENVRLLRFAVQEARTKNLSPHETADAVYNLGQDLELRGQLDEAEALFRDSLRVYGDDPSVLCERSEIEGELAYVQVMREDVQGSLPTYQRAYAGATSCSGRDSRGALTEQEYLADALVKLGRAPEALPMMVESMPAWRKLLGDSQDLSEPLYFLAEANVETGHFAEAAAAAQEGIAVQTGKIAPTDRRFGALNMLWARALVGEHRYQEALPHAEIADRLLALNAVSPGAKKVSAEAHQRLLTIQSELAENNTRKPSTRTRP